MSTLRYIILFFIILSLLNVTLATRCGPNFKNVKCPDDKCCSRKGVCGRGAHCGRGCQPNFGRCNKFVQTHTKACVTQTSPSFSVDNLCGPNHGNAKCRNNLCCSKSGRCGSTPEYCKSGCQSSFGKCDSSDLTLSSSSTTATKTETSAETETPTIPTTETTEALTSCSKSPTSSSASTTEIETPNTQTTSTPNTQTTSTPNTQTTSTSITETTTTTETATSITSSSITSSSSSITTSSSTISSSSSPTSISSSSPPTSTTTSALPISTDGACGPKNGNTVCPNDDCCSVNGFCGSTKDYCGTGCQQGFGFCGIINDGLEIITTCSNENTIAITFDDGPRQITSTLLDKLAEKNAKATFFINGHAESASCIYDFADIIQRAHTEGHLLGSHTWSHPHLAQVNESEIVYQFDQLETAFKKILGTTPKYFRPPFGEGLNNPTIRKELLERGYKVALWDIDTRDFDGELNTSKELFLQRFNESAKGTPHIVLNHDTVVTTSEQLGPFEVEYSISQGYQVQTVADCIGDINPEDWYNGPVIFGTRDDTWKCTPDDMHIKSPSLGS